MCESPCKFFKRKAPVGASYKEKAIIFSISESCTTTSDMSYMSANKWVECCRLHKWLL